MIKKSIVLGLILGLLLMLATFAEETKFYKKTVLDDGLCIVYTSCEAFATPHSGIAYIYDDGGVLAQDGTFLVDPIYRQILPPTQGRAPFCTKDGLWGYFDENWQIVIEPLYRSAQNFSEGLAVVTDMTGTAGYIDREGTPVIPFAYADASAFHNGIADVSTAEEGYYSHTFYRHGKIDREGHMVEPLTFRFAEDRFPVVMSENLVEVGGVSYDNRTLSYPFLNYLGISYIPLTWDTCRAMGIACDFSEETGLVLSVGADATVPERGENTMQSGVYDEAALYHGTVTIEGKPYTADDFYYPLLFYRDIVYFPVLYREGMERLGVTYHYFRDDTDYPDPPRQGCMIFERTEIA